MEAIRGTHQTPSGLRTRQGGRPHQGDAASRGPARPYQQNARDRHRRIGGNRLAHAQWRLHAATRPEAVRARGAVRASLPIARRDRWRR